ncbi:MAG: GH3 auxin-responsive promoter family protein, partial [Bacteroidota bacterium]
MHLVLNNGIFYEFIPFDHHNFTEEGEMRANPQTFKIDEVKKGKEYAVLITTNAGSWRYLIGDVIRFVSIEECEIVITGRTKLFLSLCGEHLSLDNMNKAVELVSKEMNIDVREFTVLGEPKDSLFAHHWYLGTDDPVDHEQLTLQLDEHLKQINDDYRVERSAALKEVVVHVLPTRVFLRYMEQIGKVGGSNKFPRVLKKEKAKDWKAYLSQEKYLQV